MLGFCKAFPTHSECDMELKTLLATGPLRALSWDGNVGGDTPEVLDDDRKSGAVFSTPPTLMSPKVNPNGMHPLMYMSNDGSGGINVAHQGLGLAASMPSFPVRVLGVCLLRGAVSRDSRALPYAETARRDHGDRHPDVPQVPHRRARQERADKLGAADVLRRDHAPSLDVPVLPRSGRFCSLTLIGPWSVPLTQPSLPCSAVDLLLGYQRLVWLADLVPLRR